MTWAITLFLFHFAAFIGAAMLYRRAPCWMQRLSVFGLTMAMAAATVAYFIAMVTFVAPHLGWFGSWEIFLVALMIEHTAVILMIFRLVYQQHLPKTEGDGSWATSSAHFPSSRA